MLLLTHHGQKGPGEPEGRHHVNIHNAFNLCISQLPNPFSSVPDAGIVDEHGGEYSLGS